MFVTSSRWALTLLLGCLAATAGCQVVQVQDMQGRPIAGARVTTQYAATEGPSAVTDGRGYAILRRSMFGEDPNWMTVHKLGYLTRGIEYPNDSWVKVKLPSLGPVQRPARSGNAQAN